MRHLVALMLSLVLLALSVDVANLQLAESYATAGSEDIYLQPGSIEEYDYIDEDDDKDEDEQVEGEREPERQGERQRELGDNLEGIEENESSCEYSCPRYYRPVCVRRNDQLITYATPCEYHNQLRCANVAKRQGDATAMATATFELMYNNACKT